MNSVQARFQIGKQGITLGVIESLHLAFKTHKTLRVSFLKSSGRNKSTIIQMADDLCIKLKTEKNNFSYRKIGFTIILKRHGK